MPEKHVSTIVNWLDNVWDYYWYANGGAKNLEKSSLAFEGKHNAGDVNLEVAAEDFHLELGQGWVY